MKCRQAGSTIFLRLERGEELVASLKEIMNKSIVDGCAKVSGIGATDNVTIGVFNPKTKVYTKKNIREDMEILSISGNLTKQNGEPYVHIHGSFASLDNVYGGHINELYISATAEIVIDVYQTMIDRFFDEETGLNLLEL